MYKPTPNDNFGDVGRFHTKFGLPVSEGLQKHVPRKLLEFRLRFLLEEVLEFALAAGYDITVDPAPLSDQPGIVRMLQVSDKMDHAGMFDALIDEVYVVLGTAHLFGYPWQEGWDRVQEANMAKVRARADGSNSKRGSSFDVVKPEGWVAPDIAGLLAECGWETTKENTK